MLFNADWKLSSTQPPALGPLPGEQKGYPPDHLPHPLDHRHGQRHLAADADDVAEYDQARLLDAESGRHDEGDVPHGLGHAFEHQRRIDADGMLEQPEWKPDFERAREEGNQLQ